MTRTTSTASFLALGCVSALAFAGPAQAQEAEQGRKLGGMTVTDTAITEEPGRTLESPKRTRPVRDTPQTITVLTSDVIEQQNLLTLRDVLSTVPGITFGAGEGGGGYGDSINLRGYSANNDITVDGVRDSAQYTRSDQFNVDQIEVTNGANSVISGAGSVGGNINLITKRPKGDDSAVFSAGIGTDNYYRGTVDVNRRVNDLIAFRLNAMAHRNDVPGRDVEDYKRWGIAPAVTIGIDSPTRLTLQYYHQEDTNIPQYGVPYYASAGGKPAGVSRSGYYGLRGVDKQKINVDQFTATFEHEFSDKVSIRNLARWQDVRQLSIATAPQGTFCLASGVTPTGGACTTSASAISPVTATSFGGPATVAITVPAGSYLLTGPQGNVRDTRNQLMFDQIDLKAVFNTAGIEHTLDVGAAASWEKFELFGASALRNADGTNPYDRTTTARHLPFGSIADPNSANLYTGPINTTPTSYQRGEQTNYAVYALDTLKLGRFLELSLGARYDHVSGSNRTDAIAAFNGSGPSGTASGPIVTYSKGDRLIGATLRNSADLFSYRLGLTYKPVEAVSLYVAYGNSRTPSKASVNGSCSTATCNISPESAKNYEIGAKAELFDGGLLVSAAAFRNERDRYAVASNDPIVPDQQLDGHSRVDGIALSASGRITPNWSITANYTYLKGKLIQSVSDFCLNNPGASGCANSAANPDPGAGSELANTPRHSGSLFTTYALPFGLTVGYGATYQGSFAFAAPTLAAPTVLRSKAYWVHQAYLSYAITPEISAQLNVKNFTNALYYTRIRNNGWATPGDARSAVFTLNVKL
ncbi:TonB-dependent receptor [Novosphingobium sp. UBA1939]|uniref:TonB-dependent receptor n=1 Tax=Novosphingobium sp. UBA1939 TaxID=1946982 RepID=UPI0025FF921D|nr:TonB-dependent receptor [Novosphingobium sp. UBA1939]